MRYIKTYKLFESRFQEFNDLLINLKKFCFEFEDNNCQCEVWPKDEIKLNIVSLKSRGHLKNISQPFYLEIDVDIRVIELERGMINRLPEWFISNLRRIDEYMKSEGFRTKPSIRYGLDWENLETIDELADQESLIYKVRLEFFAL